MCRVGGLHALRPIDAAAGRLKAAGFPDADIFIGGASPTKANLVVRYHGTGARRPILLLAHTDVVEAKREDWSIKLFTENHREGMKALLITAKLRTDADGQTRDSKSLRQTGISLRLELGPNPDYRDIAKWARTSPAMIAAFYDQTHPQLSVEWHHPSPRFRRHMPPFPTFAFGTPGCPQLFSDRACGERSHGSEYHVPFPLPCGTR